MADDEDPFLDVLRQVKPMGLLPAGRARPPGPPAPPPPPPPRGPRPKRKRLLGRNGLPLLILSLLAEHPRTGRELIAVIEGQFPGAAGPTTVYPVLEYLLDHEFIEPAGQRRYFATEAGGGHLDANRDLVTAIFSRKSPQIIAEAFEELRQALQFLGECPDPEAAARISRVLRRAAHEIAEP